MPVNERDRARLNALIAIIKPANSLAARLEILSDEQREYYATWNERWTRFIAQHPDGEAYELSLDGYGPKLRGDINVALFGPITRIELSDELTVAMEKYKRASSQ